MEGNWQPYPFAERDTEQFMKREPPKANAMAEGEAERKVKHEGRRVDA